MFRLFLRAVSLFRAAVATLQSIDWSDQESVRGVVVSFVSEALDLVYEFRRRVACGAPYDVELAAAIDALERHAVGRLDGTRLRNLLDWLKENGPTIMALIMQIIAVMPKEQHPDDPGDLGY